MSRRSRRGERGCAGQRAREREKETLDQPRSRRGRTGVQDSRRGDRLQWRLGRDWCGRAKGWRDCSEGKSCRDGRD
eukprot:1746644-Rhodomonas_salina.1